MQKKKAAPKQKVEMGTQNVNDVDYDWLPKETLNDLSEFGPLSRPLCSTWSETPRCAHFGTRIKARGFPAR